MSAQLVVVRDPRDANPVDVLTSAIRLEFAVGTYLPEMDGPVLWGPTCAVSDCPGGRVQMQEPRLCTTHLTRWRKQGKLDIDRFLRSDRVHPLPTASGQRKRYCFSVDGTEGRLRAELQLGLPTTSRPSYNPIVRQRLPKCRRGRQFCWCRHARRD